MKTFKELFMEALPPDQDKAAAALIKVILDKALSAKGSGPRAAQDALDNAAKTVTEILFVSILGSKNLTRDAGQTIIKGIKRRL